MSEIDILLGRSITRQRKRAGLSRDEVARALHVSVATLAGFETGTRRASARQLFDLARVLDVTIEGLFDWSEVDRPAELRRPLPDAAKDLHEVAGHYDALSQSHRAAIFAFLLASGRN